MCHIAMETRFYGDSPYAPGVSKIIEAVHSRALEKRRYVINAFIENGWVLATLRCHSDAGARRGRLVAASNGDLQA